MILYFYQKNCHVFIFCLYSMYCIVDHCFYFIWWLLKEPFVFLFVRFIRLVPRCIQVRAGFQQPLGWPFVGLVFVPQVEQFGLEVAVLAWREVTSVWSEVTLVWSEVTSIMRRSDFWLGRNDHGAKWPDTDEKTSFLKSDTQTNWDFETYP